MKKIFILSIIISLGICLKIEASSLFLDLSKEEVSVGEQFYVDIVLDTQGKSINGINSSFSFNNDLFRLVRIEDSKSMINYWIDKPSDNNSGRIDFSGIIVNGFDGVIDPFNLENKLPGIILRIVFEPLSSGTHSFDLYEASATLNDGNGTILDLDDNHLSINILDSIKDISIPVESSTPQISFEIIKEKDLYDNKYVIIFNATDESSGIREVLIKEGFRKWKQVESPYLLKDQSRKSKIVLKAINLTGGSMELKIDPVYKNNISIYLLSIFVILILFLVFIKYVKNKKQQPL
ncbi:TPA: hypothetical protein DIC38_02675 [Candidatus Nomurabacteria bacterium]|nr:MAG: hypothetical protein O210_OD1C00001G0042 [Parcubacteria bacterium RAAC4_OD1_1]HCY26557.1 hypothetical protein [Candidatus Nomurabacteria bacterium]